MVDLSTPWLGLRLSNPLIVGASPMVDDLSTVRRLEDAGAAAIVLHSLFEEQPEPGALPGPGRLRARQLHPDAAILAGAVGVVRPPRSRCPFGPGGT
jgi:dihydroorotate dehydrogenase